MKALAFAVEELPPIYRHTVKLRYNEDLKFREIADACGAYLMADIAHTVGLAIAGVEYV